MSEGYIETEEKAEGKISRRDFLKYSAGVAAVAAGASVLFGKFPLPSSDTKSTAGPLSSDRLVVMVNGDELTVMNGESEVKVKDALLASGIAGKMQ